MESTNEANGISKHSNFQTPSYIKVRNPNGSNQASHNRFSSNLQDVDMKMSQGDFVYFENVVKKFQEDLRTPIVSRRTNSRKLDPVEEIQEIYKDMKEQENGFKKVLDICMFMIEKNKELNLDVELQSKEIEKLQSQKNNLEDENNNMYQENTRMVQRQNMQSSNVKELEQIISTLKEDLEEKNMLLEEFERNLNESHQSERTTSTHGNIMIMKEELSEAKKMISKINKQLKESEEYLKIQEDKHEMELKRSKQLFQENKSLKEQHIEMSSQIDELNMILIDKDQELDSFEQRIIFLEQELSKNEIHQKQKSITQVLTNNAFVKASIDLARTKSKKNSNNENVNRINIFDTKEKSQNSQQFVFEQDLKNNKVETYIKVKSQIEDYRVRDHRRKGSCPLLVVDSTGNGSGFRIYDKEFLAYRVESNKQLSYERKVVAPPHFYPFNELDKVVEDAQLRHRIPQSIRYETEYLGVKLKMVADYTLQKESPLYNFQHNNYKSESEEESEDEDAAFGQIIHEPLQAPNNHETFRPVSILDNGLGINEDDLNYDLGYGRGTNVLLGERQWNESMRYTEGGGEGNYDQFGSFAGQFKNQRESEEPDGRESMFRKTAARDQREMFATFKGEKEGSKVINKLTIETEPSDKPKENFDSVSKEEQNQNPQLKAPLETPNFQSRTKQGKDSSDKAFFQNSTPSTKLRSKKQDVEEQKQQTPNHSKKHTDESTTINISTNMNPPSPLSQLAAGEIEQTNLEKLVNKVGSTEKIVGSNSYQPTHKNSEIFQAEQLQLTMHQRGYSSNMNIEGQSAKKSVSNEEGRGSHSGGSYRSPTHGGTQRKDPNEEFFMMTLLSYKLNHKEQEMILQVDGMEMYKQAQQKGISFFQWPKWIEEQLDRVYLDYIYRKKKQSINVKPEFIEQRSKRFVPLIDIRENHF